MEGWRHLVAFHDRVPISPGKQAEQVRASLVPQLALQHALFNPAQVGYLVRNKSS